MFLAFGSVVLPIKAALMSALTLGSTLGILTWIFVDGHFSTWLNFTPTPLMALLIALIIAVVFGLATDYEVFLVSRMVEARERGMSTQEAIRIGTATTGRMITAAALILAVVAGAFVFSDLVMMKYLAFGLMAALLLDATVVRMFLVPSVMKLLGDDCWWAPRWMRRLQNRSGSARSTCPTSANGPPSRTAAAAARRGQPGCRRRDSPVRRTTRPAPTRRRHAGLRRISVRCEHDADSGQATGGSSSVPPMEAKTTRISAPGKQSAPGRERPADSAPPAPARPPSAAPATPPVAGPTTPPSDWRDPGYARSPVSKPVSKPVPTDPENKGDPADPTAALPVMRAEADDSDAATEEAEHPWKSDSQGDNGDATRPHRRGAAAASAPRTCCAAKDGCRPRSARSASNQSPRCPSRRASTRNPAILALLVGSAAGSSASSTCIALLKNATVGTASKAPTIPAMHAAGGNSQHHRKRVNRRPRGPSPAAAANALRSGYHDQQTQCQQRVDDALGQQGDYHRQKAGDQGTDQRDEGAKEHQ